MNAGKSVFSQVIGRVPHWEFQRLVRVHDQSDGRRPFSAWDHFLALAFAQMTLRESLRGHRGMPAYGATGLPSWFSAARHPQHPGTSERGAGWRLHSALAHKLMHRARLLYQDEPAVLDLEMPVYAVDSTLIDLSLALCPWANWTGCDAAVKLHTALDLRGPLPAFLAVTAATHGDVVWLDDLPIEPGSFYVMDRGYIDLRRLRRIHQAGAFFVIRERPDVRHYVAASRPVDRSTSLRADQSIRFNGWDAPRGWPDLMRRVSIHHLEQSMRLAFWTKQWTLPAATISQLYRQRWQIELFFRWVKQSLRIRTFYGTSPNAVWVQLWSAICVYLAIAITRKELGITTNLTTFVQVLSVRAFSYVPLHALLAKLDTSDHHVDTPDQRTFNDL